VFGVAHCWKQPFVEMGALAKEQSKVVKINLVSLVSYFEKFALLSLTS
jgi:hypothetical protein